MLMGGLLLGDIDFADSDEYFGLHATSLSKSDPAPHPAYADHDLLV